MKILVTGVAGFIGFHLTLTLLKNGLNVIGIDSINNYYDPRLKYDRLSLLGIEETTIQEGKFSSSNLFSSFTFVKLNIADPKLFPTVLQDIDLDVVIHLAAQAGVRFSITNPQSYVENNLVAFSNILEFCRNIKVKHLLFASSSSVYGNNSIAPFTESSNTDQPVSLYAATKKSNEVMAYSYSHLYDIPTTGLRFFTVYGPWGRPDMSPFLFANAILKEQPIKVFNQGDLKRDFTFIDDIVQGIFSLVKSEPPLIENISGSKIPPYRVLNIGNNSSVELLYFIKVMERAIGKNAIQEMCEMQQGDVYETCASVDDINRIVGYKPKVSIEVGIPIFVNWFRDYYKL